MAKAYREISYQRARMCKRCGKKRSLFMSNGHTKMCIICFKGKE